MVDKTENLDLNVLANEHYATCCEFLLQHGSIRRGPNHPAFKQDLAYVQQQENTIGLLLHELVQKLYDRARSWQQPKTTPEVSRMLDSALIFSWYQCWTKPDITLPSLLAKTIQIFRDIERRAESLLLLSKIYFRLDMYSTAIILARLARDDFEVAGNHIGVLRSDVDYCDGMIWAGEDLNPRFLDELDQLTEKIGTRQAECINLALKANISWCNMDQIEETIPHATKAVEGFRALNMPLEAADCLYRLARTHGILDRHAKGLEIIQQSIDLYDSLGVGGSGLGVFVYIVKVRYLKATGVWGPEVIEALEIALRYAREHNAPLATAQSLEEWAEVHVRERDWISARLAYAGALNECRKIESDTARFVASNCWSNLGYIKRMESGRNFGNEFIPPARY